MRKRILLIALALVLALTCVFFASCRRNPEIPSSSGDDPSGSDSEISNVRYLRVSELKNGNVTIKFNAYVSGLSYDIRYSDKVITEENFDTATKANASISGSDEITAVISDLGASLNKAYYIAVRPYVGSESNHGQILTVRAGGNMLIPIDYTGSIMNVYHGESLRSFANLFDEQDDKFVSSLYRPETNIGTLYPPPTKGDRVTYDPNAENAVENKVGMTLSPIVDMEFNHYVTTVKLYYGDLTGKYIVQDNKVVFDTGTAFSNKVTVRWSTKFVDFASDNDAWDGYYEFEITDLDDRNWNDVAINAEARFIQVIFADGEAPNEIMIYGYQSSENEKIASTLRPLPTMGEMMGMCGFVAGGGGYTPIESVSCTTVLREYHNFGWSYNEKAYPGMANRFIDGNMGNFDAQYKSYNAAGINVIPCIQWSGNIGRKVDDNGLPIKNTDGTFAEASYFEKFDPDVYFLYADNMFCFAARFGSTTSTDLLSIYRKHCSNANDAVGVGSLTWLEFGNEPNGEDQAGMVPYQLAALQSASYDGHQKTMVSSQTDNGYHLGAVNADPNMKVAMAGLAGVSGRYITSMCYWLRANRTDNNVAMDAFNFHSYFSNTFWMNNTYIQVGVSPEYYNIIDQVTKVTEFRDKYYPDKEVWITEFGWDTNPSYETMTAAHAYGEYDSHQVQAMWLVRAYLLFSSCGIDKATMYMCEDTSYDVTAVGKYGTCGVVGKDENGKDYFKDSYYYLYTLKNTLGDYRFDDELDSGNEHVWIYRFKTDDGKLAYAVWCPTMDGTKVNDFELKIDGSSATLIQAVDLDKDGVSSDLAVSNGTVKINVSENPVYVVVK